MKQAKIIAIFNQKGGVAKTTTAINLSVELVQRGKKVLLVDADQQEHLAQSLGIPQKSVNASLVTILKAEIYNKPYKKDLSSVIKKTESGVDILPGSVEMAEMDPVIYSIDPMDTPAVKFLHEYYNDENNIRTTIDDAGGKQYMDGFARIVNTYNEAEKMFYDRMEELDFYLRKADGKKILKTILSRISKNYDYIVIDCPPGLSAVTENILVAADKIIVPAKLDSYSVSGLVNLVSTVKRIKRDDNPTLEISGLLYTMVRGNLTATKAIMEQTDAYISQFIYIYDSVIPLSTAVDQALLSGETLIKYQKNNPARIGYSNFCDEFLQREEI